MYEITHDALIERNIRCPYCDESIAILIDLSAGGQTYAEDCQVCCQPISISFDVSDAGLDSISVIRES